MQEVAALSERSSYNSAQHRRQHLSSFTSLLTFVARMEPPPPPPLSLIVLLARADDGQSILLDLLQVQGLHYQHLWKTTR